jgi:hypothetical protein
MSETSPQNDKSSSSEFDLLELEDHHLEEPHPHE